MRNLRSDHQQPHSLVCDSVQRCGPHCAQVEFKRSQCARSSSLLRRSPRSGIHQSMVRVRVFTTETGLYQIGIGETLIEFEKKLARDSAALP